MEKVFLTGPDGLLGSNVVRELLARNFEVVAMVQEGRDPKTISSLPIQIAYGDVTDKAAMVNHSKGCDYFIHSAATTDMWPTRSDFYYKINYEGTKNAIEAALENKVKRFIHVGSASSFMPGSHHLPGNESKKQELGRKGHDYIISKQRAQDEVMEAHKTKGLPAIVLCPTFMIGPYDTKPGPGALVLAVAKRKLSFATGGGKSWVNVKHVAHTMVNAIERGKLGECYILGGQNLSYLQAIKIIAEACGQTSYPKKALPDSVVKLTALCNSLAARVFKFKPRVGFTMACMACQHQYYDSSKARTELGLPESPLEDAVEDLRAWFELNGYL